ncbi:LytR/AlgR family response regulator transcription factor [Pseudemcibacter aquimaris]|uniref:LytR/AlgR family response regulator transcription factor n=1 Tax=Pseudemcibacter aquimaris TaxID=2857064 RepID=UPI0020139426|nr:LytTR family DNA-binding domain-containing protein [Pseudemcibacter aquimaris]MCC3861463.1 LytTR family transcriptional regulator [Pseudemcibacter aquimaris]WDU58232.1 LytTR family transcriptional regulator [Pseudemcibacter aquimaris]
MIQTIKRHWKMLLVVFSYMTFEAIVRSTSLIMEYENRGDHIAAWKPFVWEFTSTYMIFALVPFIIMYDERYPIARKEWFKRILIHIPLSMLFSIVHVMGMIAMRKLIFSSVGDVYSMDDLDYMILYEYRKDLTAYISILIVTYAYREILRLRHGEAQIEKSEEERIMVSKSGQFKFIDPLSVNWVESAGNYVELHVGEDTYMLRATMKDIENRLGDKEFARIHRSAIVRKDFIDSIKPASSGDKQLTLKDGTSLRVSRRYNENLKAA